MASVARSGWHRFRSSLADEVAARNERAIAESAEREAETLRQMSDVFSELGRLSRDVGVLHESLHELRVQSDQNHLLLDEIRSALNAMVDTDSEATAVLGRVLQSTRSRLDSLEDAAQTGP
ncbi:MAG TPA: hypothetical protein VGP46_10575 [Acidimicrobiales bacterium]|nr:hypothetical protein [Acidimicrobiales bacterium]